MKKWILLLAAAGVVSVVIASLLLIGPEMTNQPNVRAYQARMPLPPAGVVAVEPSQALPSASEAVLLKNPLSPAAPNLARGRTYYGYYCRMCHGEVGDGNGPVGQSFVPSLPDLRAAKTQSLSDGQILRTMLTGVGHQPADLPAGRPAVLEYTVLPEHRWYLVLYLRSLAADAKTAPP